MHILIKAEAQVLETISSFMIRLETTRSHSCHWIGDDRIWFVSVAVGETPESTSETRWKRQTYPIMDAGFMEQAGNTPELNARTYFRIPAFEILWKFIGSDRFSPYVLGLGT